MRLSLDRAFSFALLYTIPLSVLIEREGFVAIRPSFIPPPLWMVLFAGLIWGMAWHMPYSLSSHISILIRSIGLGCWICVGLYIDFAALVSFRRHQTTISPFAPDRTSALVTTGIYRYSRNPMYLGLACYLIGWTWFLAAPEGLIMIACFMLVLRQFHIIPEEWALKQHFGKHYVDYQCMVPRWIAFRRITTSPNESCPLDATHHLADSETHV